MKAIKKTFNDIKIGDIIYAYDYELNYGFKMKVTRLNKIISYNNFNIYTLFICERDFDHKDHVIIIESEKITKTSYKDKNMKILYFVNEKDYNNKIY